MHASDVVTLFNKYAITYYAMAIFSVLYRSQNKKSIHTGAPQ